MRRSATFDWRPLTMAAALVLALIPVRAPSAQQVYVHVNPMVEKLAQGKPVIGVSTYDLSMESAHSIVRSDIDFIRIEMEHGPMNFESLKNFLLGMLDKAAILKKGNAQINVAPIARFAPYGRENAAWVAKQALDIGLMGVIFNGVDNKEQTLTAVRNMRYPQLRGAKYFEPAGLRGVGPQNAVWFWGIDDYNRHADLWPLNPEGDLLAGVMIETVEGLKNVDEIASVPGVGFIFPGAAADLSNSLGITAASPEREAALQTILKACKAHNVVCGISVNANDIQKRIQEGWRYLDLGPATGLSVAADAGVRAGRAMIK